MKKLRTSAAEFLVHNPKSQLCLASLIVFLLCGCTTTAAKKAMDKPMAKDKYSGFDADAADASKREVDKLPPVTEDSEPRKAITTLGKFLRDKRRSYRDSAEQQLFYWGAKQGVDRLVVSEVRPLLKNADVELRAPALRLTVRFGGDECNGDLIESLADSDSGMREMAFQALNARAHRDFGYDPGGGEVARGKAVEEWRRWWQYEKRRVAVQAPSVYELNPQSEPKVVTSKPVADPVDATASDSQSQGAVSPVRRR